ncbi:MAG TPA: membrane protein insertase YidC [Opitutaceae bacterium]|nr:membrane protein insertase YidC [Opitutaceae bacterium]
MDKKNTILGIALLVAAFALMYFGAKRTPPAPPAPELAKPVSGANPAANTTGAATSSTASTAATAPLPATTPTTSSNAVFAPLSQTDSSAKVISLGNDFIEVRFVDFGGAIESVALNKYPAEKNGAEPFVFNHEHVDPILAFTDETFPGLDRTHRYDVVSQTANEVVFRTVFENRIEVTRRYVVPPSNIPRDQGDPYQVYHETTFRNLTDKTAPLPHFAWSIGTAAPAGVNDYGMYLATGYNDGKDIDFIKRAKLEGGGILSWIGAASKGPVPRIDTSVPLLWASVEDQFFASILTPTSPGRGLTTRRVELPPLPNSQKPQVGVAGSAGFDVPALAPNGEQKVSANLYVGPKEYKRLSNPDVFKVDQDKVMQFGMFKIFSQILLTMMTWIQGMVGNWGVAIVITTLTLKTLFLPLTLSASRSAKRMQKIQPQMTALREKYKDNPQKLNQATLELFKEQKVNPMGGCFPVLLTIPFFFGFYAMLRSTSELRFAEFLWAKDLSAPDTVATLFNIPINIMPILLGLTMVVQMRLTPQPTVDNAQAKMMKFMPYMFAIFCYNLSCALSLYSTINGIFTIGQQLIINRMKDPEPAPAAAVAASGGSGRNVKNVTPAKKKLK